MCRAYRRARGAFRDYLAHAAAVAAPGKWLAMLLCSKRINGKEVRLVVLVQSDKQQAQALSCACQINKAAPLAAAMFIKAVLARDEMPLRADGVYERLIADNDEGWRRFRRSTPQFSRC
ncbi:hypothetical protein BBB57_21870 [Kosakonia sacchari]|uniref:hypothetical protein n=1 Tax=Kosakonia sacchari TaxID=1158459 RepID=UPI00080751C1|nr:hypothetical protein [Kosakonia sacchari]ANR80662.1 hypothetical protein BBB57_21870 [Kosakonia sacchari]